jgi:hypothetical protein
MGDEGSTGRQTHRLLVEGAPVADYVVAADLPVTVSPRPYFHPVRTLGGVSVTEALAPDHPHHLGISVSMPEADGVNFWGGRTYTREHGYRWLDNHGTQRHVSWHTLATDRIDQSLSWCRRDGRPVLAERRTVSVHDLDVDSAWLFDLAFTLTNEGTGPIELRSPTCNGRPDAGYGGYFWRVPKHPENLTVLTAEHDDVVTAYGTAGAWLVMNGSAADGRAWSLLFVQEDVAGRYDRWFVRTTVNPGVGSCLAWAEPAVLKPKEALRRRIRTVVMDGATTRDRALQMMERLAAPATDQTS